jgi:hypothetical protein
MKRIIYLLFIPVLICCISACKKGDLYDNIPPSTHISVNRIDLSGNDRLNSNVTLSWYGTDADGYIIGYEISLNNRDWFFTEKQDSTFIFSTELGSDTSDINFYVRAIDNMQARDPEPAYLKVPVKNTRPTAVLDEATKPGKLANDTLYSVIPLMWRATDLDGDESIDSVFVKINDGDWYALRRNVSFINIVAADPTATGITEAIVYTGTQMSALPARMKGLRLNGANTVYLKARDIAGAESKTDTTGEFYVKNKTSDLLIVNGHGSTMAPTPQSIYLPAIQQVYGGYDYIDLMVNAGRNRPRFWNSSFLLYLRLYDKIFWYGNAIKLGSPINQLLLEYASNPIQGYLNSNKKILISSSLPNRLIDLPRESPLFQFTPMDSISYAAGQARILADSLVYALQKPAYSDLIPGADIRNTTPFYPKADARVLYKARITAFSGWTGPDNMIASRSNSAGRTNVVFVSTELHFLNKNPESLTSFFNEVLNKEFNW